MSNQDWFILFSFIWIAICWVAIFNIWICKFLQDRAMKRADDELEARLMEKHWNQRNGEQDYT